MSRITRRFAELRAAGRSGLVAFVTGGDPDLAISRRILAALPESGADLIEIGVPFSDPMADGPTIQEANLRALGAGAHLPAILGLVRQFRERDDRTPIVLMGYFNPILAFGIEPFVAEARAAGVDGLIVVDLPPEEDPELRLPARKAGLDFIRLATPTSDERRLARILDGASGFLYYVSIAGITGTRAVPVAAVREALAPIRQRTALPVAVGFGVRTPADAAALAGAADAVVVGSALVGEVKAALAEGRDPAAAVAGRVAALAEALRGARRSAGGEAARAGDEGTGQEEREERGR